MQVQHGHMLRCNSQLVLLVGIEDELVQQAAALNLEPYPVRTSGRANLWAFRTSLRAVSAHRQTPNYQCFRRKLRYCERGEGLLVSVEDELVQGIAALSPQTSVDCSRRC